MYNTAILYPKLTYFSLLSENKLSDNKLNGSSVSLPLNRTLSNLSLQAKHLNKSNSSVGMWNMLPGNILFVVSSLDEACNRLFYQWCDLSQIDSPVIQYTHMSLNENWS